MVSSSRTRAIGLGRRSLEMWGSRSLRALACLYIVVLLIIPLGLLARDGVQAGLDVLWQSIIAPVAWHAIVLTLWTTTLMTLINAVMGTLIAYVLVRYDFVGKTLLNGLIDVPLAIPTLVTGVMFVVLFGPQTSLGIWLARFHGLQIIFAPPGIVLVLLFITLPLFVRAVEPVLENLDRDPEAAAATLGANGWTIFWRVTLPRITPALLSGALLGFARGVGEFGAIVLVAGNIPFHTETAAVYVLGAIESGTQASASAISLLLLTIALALVLLVEALQRTAPSGGWQ